MFFAFQRKSLKTAILYFQENKKGTLPDPFLTI